MKQGSPFWIKLTDEDLEVAHDIASGFGGSKAPGQSERSRLSASSQYEVDFTAACGRIAFIERVMGLTADRTPSRNGDKGRHLSLGCGCSMDVKVTRIAYGDLVIGGNMPGMNKRTAILGLCEVPKDGWDGRSVKVAGWIRTENIKDVMERRDLGHGMRDVVRQSRLSRDWEAIKAMAAGVVVPIQTALL